MNEIRHSKRRDLIVKLFEKEHLLSAQEIVEKVKSQMDRATVYRNLSKLVEMGILKEIAIEKGFSNYELSTNHHQHFKCDNCDKILAVEIDEDKIKKMVSTDKLKVNSIQLNITGICEDCN